MTTESHSHHTRWTSLATRLGAISLTAGAVILAFPGTAPAHVTVSPGTVEGGGFAVVSFRVPTERDDASTTQVRVTLPEDQPVGSVRTTPVPGWKIAVKTRTLDEPIDFYGDKLTEVVSTVTWSAAGAGIAPGQFEDFDVSMGPLPESGEMTFQALQTYSSGERVNWNQVAVDDEAEPEHPAPVLQLIQPAAEDDSTSVSANAGGDRADETNGESAQNAGLEASSSESTDTVSTLAVAMSAIALLLSLVALVLAGKRRNT